MKQPQTPAVEAAASQALQADAALAARYGGTAQPHKKPGGLDWVAALAMSSPAGHFAVVYLGGVGSFFVEAIFFTFLLFDHAFMAIVIFLVIECTCVRLIFNRNKSPYHYPLGICCALAAFLGAFVGAYNYDKYGYFAYVYSRSRDYENVVPLQHSGAVADAGGIVFSDEAHVDVKMSAGYVSADGQLYCAAPVRGTDNSTTVEFWAVGTDCCGSLGDFSCGSAGDPAAHGAKVVLPEGGFFRKSYIEDYENAREKAEANHHLHSPGPLYVHWIASEDVNKIAAGYLGGACGIIFLATFVYALLSAVFVWILCRAFMQSFMPALDYGVF